MIHLILGPTASGKSDIAMQIARKKNGAIVNIDSMQGYKDIPILSAAPSSDDMMEIPHFLYGFLNSNESISLGLWLQNVEKTILSIMESGRRPIICGGTMMYGYRLLNGVSEIPDVSSAIMNDVEDLYVNMGHEAFLQMVLQLDQYTPKDPQRLKRNMCLLKSFGKSLGEFIKTSINKRMLPQCTFNIITPNRTREEIYSNCNARFEKMIKMGAIDEVSKVMDCKPISRAAGFDEIKRYILREISLEDAIILGKQRTRNYAKSQATWMAKIAREGFKINYFEDSEY